MADNKKNNNTPAENTKAEAKATKSEKKPNIVARAAKKFVKFIKDTKGELKKVVWTSKTEVWKSFKLVIATVVVVSLAIAVIDYGSSLLINTIAGLIG